MRPEKFFVSHSFDNLDFFKEMNLFLWEHITPRIEIGRPSLALDNTEYKRFLEGRELPYEGRDWRDVFDGYSKMFQEAVIWQSPGAMINITPPANMASITASFWASLFNPNFACDESSGFLLATELLAVRYLTQLAGWEADSANGVFTFGGKGTNMYAVRTGLRKAFSNIDKEGFCADKCIVFTSDKAHPCHKEVCAWLGIGTAQVCVIPTDRNGRILINILEQQMRNAIENQIRIGCIFLNGGTTNDTFIDPMKKVVLLRDKLAEEYGLDYMPHIHADAVIGWCWLFFRDYDFDKNELGMTEVEIKKVKSLSHKISEICMVDSFGADFHKTGFCPYVSSVFMIRDGSFLDNVHKRGIKTHEEMELGEYAPFEYSLELTRSAAGPVSAFIALEVFGIKGFQKLIYNVFSSGELIRRLVNSQKDFEVINNDTEGFATLFVVYPPDETERYSSMISLNDSKKIEKFMDYNQQFFFYVRKAYQEHRINLRITFSKSFKPYGADFKTGALKFFQMSPIVTAQEWESYIYSLFELKKEFDKSLERITDLLDRPRDMVYEEE